MALQSWVFKHIEPNKSTKAFNCHLSTEQKKDTSVICPVCQLMQYYLYFLIHEQFLISIEKLIER